MAARCKVCAKNSNETYKLIFRDRFTPNKRLIACVEILFRPLFLPGFLLLIYCNSSYFHRHTFSGRVRRKRSLNMWRVTKMTMTKGFISDQGHHDQDDEQVQSSPVLNKK